MTRISLNTYIILNIILFYFNFKEIRKLKSFKINIITRNKKNFNRVMLISLIITLMLLIISLFMNIVNYLKHGQIDIKVVSIELYWIQMCIANIILQTKYIK